MRSVLVCLAATLTLAAAPRAAAQPPAGSATDPLPTEVESLERLRGESIASRRVLADSVLVAGLVSVGGGAALIVPDGNDQAWRLAGINTVIFGAVNTLVGLLALRGIAAEERTWEAGRAERRTPDGLTRARIHAALDERRESVGQAVNLGLDFAYLGVGAAAALASQLGVDHPNRWLASGAAVGFQALFLVGIDLIGLTRSQRDHRAILEGFAPHVSIVPTPTGSETRLGFSAAF